MPYLFPSPEWVEQLKTEINRSEAYANSAKTWEGDFHFIVEPGGPITESFTLYLDLWHGKCRDAHPVTGEGNKKPEFVISGTLDAYRAIFNKKLDPIQALMTRKLKLQGNMGKIMRAVKATLDLVNCCGMIETVYPA
ncbi:MAG: SCP2 sterol-binding domain-containing protein [Chloroflexi bacterium]|nr:SCP2 sterol-binding domain-containing protein [Chloroflexota bacterium]